MSLSASHKGCESGWTLYLDETSSHFPEDSNKGGRKAKADDDDEEEEEEEDLSMVSDASSRPPSHEVEDECSNESCSKGKRRSKGKSKKKAAKGEQQQHLSNYYEDTARSPHLKCTEKEKTEPPNFHHNKNSAHAPAEKANSGRKGGLKNRKWA
ncbi:hypothetical protein MLD38_022361 [Melastoma candidum]|uniref:Uncharacterized protein n=1 Tax=Melastoma candidum TaxID=119954 RepID=A0ACB9QK79_9MYRT|nr:hypothetical protein MLD38_022361 [Melastoma candidum]